MATFLERYQAGDHVAVWDDLVALSEGVRHELYFEDASAVAAETMRRARHNVELLITRLADAGYRFVPPSDDPSIEISPDFEGTPADVARRVSQAMGREVPPGFEDLIRQMKERLGARAEKSAAQKAARKQKVTKSLKKSPLQNRDVFDPPGSETAAQLKKLEKQAGGPLPLSLRAWYEQVGSVSLLGSHDVFNPRSSEGTADPLVVAPLRELLEMADAFDDDCGGGMHLWIAPDDLHKANVSGGDPYTITVPNAAADAELECEWHHTTFVGYLRKVFDWGGFPGWERAAAPPREAIAQLTRDLLPI
jgi:hypothetical protein